MTAIASGTLAEISELLKQVGSTGGLVLGIALCTISNLLANRGADRERARREACDRERELEIRGQVTAREDRLLALHRQVTRQ
jgi:hypothetical protein